MICLRKTIFINYLILINSHSGYTSKDESEKDPRKQAPWVASVFKQNEKGMWKFHCGATLINSHIVITATSCVLADYSCWTPLHLKYSDLRVVVGLSTSDYYAKRDEYTQEAEVSFIIEHKPSHVSTSCGSFQRKRTNLAGVFLKNQFNISGYVKPAKITKYASETSFLEEEKSVVIAGFNKNRLEDKKTSKLEIFKLQIQPHSQCLKAYRKYPVSTIELNVFCGRTTGIFPCFLEGSGAIIPSSVDFGEDGIVNSPLMGVYTSNTVTASRLYPRGYYFWPNLYKETKCSQNETAFFTNHGEYNGWATSLSSCGPTKLKCQKDGCFDLDELCDGIPQCKDKTDESFQACKNQNNCTDGQFRCKYGACIDVRKMCDGNRDCADNSDESDDEKCQQFDIMRNISCPPIPPRIGVSTECYTQGGGRVENCNTESVPVGTKAIQTCQDYYRGNSKTIKCQRNGNWSVSVDYLLTCVPDCGISEPKTPYIVGGTTVGTVGEWPWHATIYKINQNRKWVYFCGGSLISTMVVLTAAHCITEKKSEKLLNPAKLRIVFGKLHSAYESDEKEYTQEIPIYKLITHDSYNPGTYGSDIGLIILKSPIQISGSVRPVCFSKDVKLSNTQFNNAVAKNGTQLGTVVGFGIDESNKNSLDLKTLKLPFVPSEECMRQSTSTRRQFRNELFCGGYTNGSAVCPGDSGGGFVFPNVGSYPGSKFNQRYYVQGVVSHGDTTKNKSLDPCNKNAYKYFTKVVVFADWIQNIVSQTEFNYESHNEDSEENRSWPFENSSSSGEDEFVVGIAMKNEVKLSTLIYTMTGFVFLSVKIILI